MKLPVAVLISGCGHMDGAEINEAVLALLALSEHKLPYQAFSIDLDQPTFVSHISGKYVEESSSRNMMTESARIVRGNILDIADLNPKAYSALVMPGGFGVAKNFSNLATDRNTFQVYPEIAEIIVSFFNAKRPICGICISPAIIAKALQGRAGDLCVTLGSHSELLDSLYIAQKVCKVDEIVIDMKNKVISTPAFMIEDAELASIYRGITRMIEALVAML